MDSAKDQLVEKLTTATNILVTVSRNPSVDQLAACLGLTLLLNKFGKHATAVFSGTVPSTLEFLEPEQTLEKTTDSLRDFIIALDKSKADKLRYKVEDEMVRIFITPYHTSLSSNDLEFSQGDFNIDVVIALGVSAQEDFDEAITAHGRILHDAVVSSITTTSGGELGSINWTEPAASSLSELIVDLSHSLAANLIDGQIATALLTGIVSETARFSNEKTTPQTMSVSAELMAAGANQQLVATKLETPVAATASESPVAPVQNTPAVPETTAEPAAPKSQDGTLEINHEADEPDADAASTPPADELEVPAAEPGEDDGSAAESGPHELITEPTSAEELVSEAAPTSSGLPKSSKMITEPPSLGGQLTANSQPESLDPAVNPLNEVTNDQPTLLNRSSASTIELPQPEPPTPPAASPPPEPILTGFTPPPPAWVPPSSDGPKFDPSAFAPKPAELPSPSTPAEPPAAAKNLETNAEAPNVGPPASAAESVEDARDEVLKALSSEPIKPEPVQALGAQPLGDPLRPLDPPIPAVDAAAPSFTSVLQQAIPTTPIASLAPLAGPELPVPPLPPAAETTNNSAALPPSLPGPIPAPVTPTVIDPTAPPPVPPPIPFNFGPPT